MAEFELETNERVVLHLYTGFAMAGDVSKFYFDGAGKMQTGWQEIGGKTYYFRSSGAMQTGPATIDGRPSRTP